MYKHNQHSAEDYKSMGISIGLHLVLLLLFFLLIVWRMPDPPPPGLPGVEINLGFENSGSGDIQTNTTEEQTEEQKEEVVEEEVTEEADLNEEVVTTEQIKSSVVVKEEVKLRKEPVKEVVETKNLFNKPDSKSDGDKKTPGDQGNEEGNPDSRNLYKGANGNGTNGGGGNGASLDMPGWMWDSKPDKKDPTSENGYVVFEFYVDEDGSVINVKKIGGANLTPTEENFYKQQLLETSFSLTDPKKKAPARTRGVYTFRVKSK